MTDDTGELFVGNTKTQCKQLKQTVEKARLQVTEEEFFRKSGAESVARA